LSRKRPAGALGDPFFVFANLAEIVEAPAVYDASGFHGASVQVASTDINDRIKAGGRHRPVAFFVRAIAQLPITVPAPALHCLVHCQGARVVAARSNFQDVVVQANYVDRDIARHRRAVS
jgi:hypothetical protein